MNKNKLFLLISILLINGLMISFASEIKSTPEIELVFEKNNIDILKSNLTKILNDKINSNNTKHLSFKINTSMQKETFFDNKNFYLLENNNSISYIFESLFKKNKLIKKNESVNLNLNSNVLVKYPVQHYKNAISITGKHSLYKLLKRNAREMFISKLTSIGLNNYLSIIEVISADIMEHRIDVLSNGQRVYSILLQLYTLKKFGIKKEITFITILPGIESNDVDKLLKEVIGEIEIKNSDFIKSNDIKYKICISTFIKNFPLFKFIIQYPTIFKIIRIIFISMLGGIIYLIFFKKRLFEDIE